MLEIEVDRLAIPGTPCGGLVRWIAPKDLTPTKIVVTVGWETEGRGDVDRGEVLRGEMAPGPVSAGDALELPFEATIPADMPVSFDAALIRLKWKAKARVDLPWAFDETAEVTFHVGDAAAAVPVD